MVTFSVMVVETDARPQITSPFFLFFLIFCWSLPNYLSICLEFSHPMAQFRIENKQKLYNSQIKIFPLQRNRTLLQRLNPGVVGFPLGIVIQYEFKPIKQLYPKSTMLLAVVALITTLAATCQSQVISFTASLSVTTINANSIYTFSIVDMDLSSRSGNIIIGFPSGLYSIASVTCFNSSNVTQFIPCSVSGGNQVVIVYTAGAFNFQSISLSTVKNPGMIQSLNFTYVLTNAASAPPTAYSVINPLTPDALQSCSVSFSPSTVFTQSVGTFTIVTKNVVQMDGSITITFPSSWALSATTSYPPLMSTSSSCAKVSGAPLRSNLTCSIFSNKLQVEAAFGTAVPAGTTIVFTANRIRTPPTTNPSNNVTINTETSSGSTIDLSTCAVAAATQRSLTLSTNSTFVVGASNTFSFSWATGSPLRAGDIITITLPDNYMSFNSFLGAWIQYGIKVATRSISAGNSTQQIRITIESITDPEIVAGTVVRVSDLVVFCLVDASPRSVSVVVSRSGSNMESGTLSITPAPNTLKSVTMTADVRIVSSPMTVNITLTTANALASTSQLRVQIPSALQLTGSSPLCSISSPSSPSSVLSTINCSLSGYTLTIAQFLQSPTPSDTILSLIISNAFRNPQTTQPSTAVIVSTMSQLGFLIDQHSTTTYTATAGTIGNLNITPASYEVFKDNIYTLSYTLTRVIRSGSVIAVTVPGDIAIAVSPSYSYSVNGSAFTTITPSVAMAGADTVLRFTGIIVSSFAVGTNIRIIFNRLTNPQSLMPSASFGVATTYNGYTIQQLNTGLGVTMTTMATFTQVVPVISAPMNGATRDYTFFIKPLLAIAAGQQLVLEIVDNTNGTNQLSFPATSMLCPIFYNSIQTDNSCSLSGSTLTITLSTALTDTLGVNQYRLVVSSIILARTPRASSSLRLTSFRNGFGVQTRTVGALVNTEANLVQSLVLTILSTPAQLNTLEQLRFVIRTFNGIDFINGEYFVIEVPTSFTYRGPVTSICTSAIYSCSIYNSNTHTIKVSASGSFTTVGLIRDFTVIFNESLFVSPTSYNFQSDYFYVTTYTSNNLVIDRTDPIAVPASRAVYELFCLGRCKTCLDSNRSYCQSCYQTGEGVLTGITFGGYNMMTSDHQCVDVCGNGYYNSSGVCMLCVSPCARCNSATECTSCLTSFFYIASAPLNARCVSECPVGTFANAGICSACSNSCLNCSNLATQCTACPNSTYLSGTQCVSSCPDGTYEDLPTQKCLPCDAGCLSTCTVNATDCVGCKAGYFRPSPTSSECVNSCPVGRVSNTLTNICQCSPSCLTCAGTLTNCTSCSTPLFLYINSCINDCPAQTYQIPNTTTCTRCIDQFCTQCNVSSCLICSSGYYLHAGTCVNACPDGYRLQNYQCLLCPTGCRTCLTDNSCTACFNGFLTQANACVSRCSTGYLNFNATSCVSECPSGYYSNSDRCDLIGNNTQNVTIVNNTTPTLGRIIPFPYTIAYVIVVGVAVGMKCLYPPTILASALMSMGSVLEVLASVTVVAVAFVQGEVMVAGVGLLLAGLAMIYVCNVVGAVLVVKVLHADDKFLANYRKTTCANVVIRIVACLTYHKFHQIVFSNIFGVRAFSSKVDFVRRLQPFNILLIISFALSVMLVAGASIISYKVQSYTLQSSTFIQSIDCILIVVLNVIPTVLVLRRKDVDYETEVFDGEAKRYETHDQLNANNDSVGIDEVFIEQSGVLYNRTAGQNRKNYFYQNSKRSGTEDPYETPLDRKKLSANPMGSSMEKNPAEESSEALKFGNKSGLNHKADRSLENVNEDLQEIILEENDRGDMAAPGLRSAGKRKALGQATDQKDASAKVNGPQNHMINYVGYDLDSRLLQIPQSSQEFKKLPAELKARIRLAKANLQINNNSARLRDNEQSVQDVEVIQLSPKKQAPEGKKQKGQGENSDISLPHSGTQLFQMQEDQGLQAGNNKGSPKKSTSKEKSKNGAETSKQNNLMKRNTVQIENVDEESQEGTDEREKGLNNKMPRNRSQQINKKDLDNNSHLKSTKSQKMNNNKKGPKKRNSVNIVFNNMNPGAEGQNDEFADNNQADDIYEDEPTLPIFKHKSKQNIETRIGKDGLDTIQENERTGQRVRGARGGEHQSMNLDQHMQNLRRMKGERTIPSQQPDDLPQLHSSEQLNNLIIVNKSRRRKPGQIDVEFSNDDSSIYKKIYNDDTQTLKSVPGENFLNHEISPSQFNNQNQRYDDTETNDAPVPATLEIDQDYGEYVEDKDGLPGQGIRRYTSSNNLDYDEVISKRINNDRIKELEKIYLPRLDARSQKRKK